MKDGDEYQRTECNHTGHALFTALTSIFFHHSSKLIVTVETESCLYGERHAKELRSQKIFISANDSVVLPILNPHSEIKWKHVSDGSFLTFTIHLLKKGHEPMNNRFILGVNAVTICPFLKHFSVALSHHKGAFRRRAVTSYETKVRERGQLLLLYLTRLFATDVWVDAGWTFVRGSTCNHGNHWNRIEEIKMIQELILQVWFSWIQQKQQLNWSKVDKQC